MSSATPGASLTCDRDGRRLGRVSATGSWRYPLPWPRAAGPKALGDASRRRGSSGWASALSHTVVPVHTLFAAGCPGTRDGRVQGKARARGRRQPRNSGSRDCPGIARAALRGRDAHNNDSEAMAYIVPSDPTQLALSGCLCPRRAQRWDRRFGYSARSGRSWYRGIAASLLTGRKSG